MVTEWVAVLSIALVGQLTLAVLSLGLTAERKRPVIWLSAFHLALCGYLLVPAMFTSLRAFLLVPVFGFGFFQSFIGQIVLGLYQSLTKQTLINPYLMVAGAMITLASYGLRVGSVIVGMEPGNLVYGLDLLCAVAIQAPCLLLAARQIWFDVNGDLRNDTRRARIVLSILITSTFCLVMGVYLALSFFDVLVSGTLLPNLDWRFDYYYWALWGFAAFYALGVSPILLTRRGQTIFDDFAVVNDALGLQDEPQLDRAGLDRLLHLITIERVYTNSLLSIGALADRMDLPAHQLRALINKSLGWRNFNHFLNSYRLADAMAILADPALARTPILTIALDLGFGSAQSFNRVFKAEVGMTPTDYREKALGYPPVESNGDLPLAARLPPPRRIGDVLDKSHEVAAFIQEVNSRRN